METKQESPEGEDSGAADLRGTLIKRLAVAGVLVAILLAMLAVFDHLSSTPEETESPVFARPVPVAPKKEVSQPVTPATNLPEPPVAEVAPPPPKIEASPPVEAETKPEAQPAKTLETRAGTSASTVLRAGAPAAAPAAPATGRPLRPAPELTAAPSEETELPAATVSTAPARPTARVLEPRVVPAPKASLEASPPAVQRLFSGFVLQAGVFSSAQRAEELHAKLTLSGVPSSLETRVQVGPFRTRQEAEAAQNKLKELGVDSVLVPPRGGKP